MSSIDRIASLQAASGHCTLMIKLIVPADLRSGFCSRPTGLPRIAWRHSATVLGGPAVKLQPPAATGAAAQAVALLGLVYRFTEAAASFHPALNARRVPSRSRRRRR